MNSAGFTAKSGAKPHLLEMTDQEFSQLSSFVKTRYGIDLTQKRTLIQGRLTNDLRGRGINSFQEYLKLLHNDPSGTEITNLLNRLTTNLSYFLRENEHFDFMTKTILPYWDRTSKTKDLRIWSAGCSAGQEAYTTQMVIHEYFGPRKSLWDTTILATDISAKAMNKAKAGVYTHDELKDIPPAWKSKYFVPAGPDSLQVCDKIRREVVFRPFNLMDPFQFKKPFDLIFCRNVMIYFDTDTKKQLVKKFYDWTVPGGYFFISHSESLNSLGSQFKYVHPAIYQKQG